jgi:ArsR family transcriptional regulator, arsenate/arsenite/antimonite-responsive transcriptional repressor
MRNAPDIVTICKALGDPTRLKILELLKSKGRSACDIEEAVKLSQAAINHHMGLLRRAGLVNAEKRGRWIYYSRNEVAIAGITDTIAKAV